MPSVIAPTLRGIIVRDDDDKVIVQATRQDVQRFAPRPGQEVNVRPATVRVRARQVYAGRGGVQYAYGHHSWPGFSAMPPEPNYYSTEAQVISPSWTAMSTSDDPPSQMEPGDIDPGDYLFDRYGRAVATVLDVSIHVERIEMTALGDTVRDFTSGPVTIDVRAVGLPGVSVNGQRVGR